MQKIMFEHRRFGLEQAVIARQKEMTRRKVCFPKDIRDKNMENAVRCIDKKGRVYFTFYTAKTFVDIYPRYQIGERVALAQSYKDAGYEPGRNIPLKEHGDLQVRADSLAGWTNKMFVRADLMPHVIKITDIKAERLQDISDEDCLREGIIPVTWRQWHDQDINDHSPQRYTDHSVWTLEKFREGIEDPWADSEPDEYMGSTAKAAFAVLIFKLQSRKAWERNEWQFAYTFKLEK